MNKEIFSDPEYIEDIAVCLHKMMGENKSLDALRKAHTQAFVDRYMVNPEQTEVFHKKDVDSAADLLFSDWLKTIDIRDYFRACGLLNDLLRGMSANELKLLLADEMEVYYKSFRKDVVCSAFEKEENESCHKAKSDKSFIDLLSEVLNDKPEDKDENSDEDEGEDEGDGVEEDEDYNDDWGNRRCNEDEDDEDDEDKDEDEDEGGEDELEKLFNIVVERIRRSLRKEGRKNENKGN